MWNPRSPEKGQGLVEYALILVLIAIVVIAILALLGGKVNTVFARIIMEIEYPGQYGGGSPVTVTLSNTTADVSCVGPDCSVTARTTIGGTSDPAYVVFWCSGGGQVSNTGTGTLTATFDDAASSGEMTVCVLGVEGHSVQGGSVCDTVSY